MPAPAFVQSNAFVTVNQLVQFNSLAFNSPVTAGNLLIAHAIWRTMAGEGPSVSDSAGNAWTIVGSVNVMPGNWWEALFVCYSATSGPNTVLFEYGGGNNSPNIDIGEYSGVTAVSDGFNSTLTPSGTSITSGNITTTTAADLLLGFSGTQNPVSYGSGWINRFAGTDKDTYSDQIVSSIGTYAYTLTAATGGGIATIYALKGGPIPIDPCSVQSPTNSTSTSLTLNGTLTALGTGGNATTVGFNWGLTKQYGNTVSTTGTFGVGPFASNVTGLTNGLVYHYRAFTVNPSGTFFSGDNSFQAGVQLPTFIQSCSVDGAPSSGFVTATMNVPSTAGNTLVVCAAQFPSTTPIIGVTDSANNQYQILLQSVESSPGFYGFVAVAYNIKVPPSESLVFNLFMGLAGTSNTHMDVLEYSNVMEAGIQSTFQLWGWNGEGTTIANPSLTTVTNNELLIQYLFTSGSPGPTITPGAGWLARTNTSTVGSFCVMEQIASSPGLFQSTASLSVFNGWANILISLAPTGSFINVPVLTYKTVPPMGWDSWYTYGPGVTTAELEANATALISTGLAAAGYKSVNPNGGGYNQQRDGNGNLIGSSGVPSMADVAAFLQNIGLNMSAYCDTGPLGTGCSLFPTVSGYETIDAALWQSMNVNYLMIDSCYIADQTNTAAPPSNAVMQWYCNQIGLAIQATGQDIQVFTSPAQSVQNGWNSYLWGESTGAVGVSVPNGIGDVGNPTYAVVMEVVDAQIPFLNLVAPGHWQQDYYLPVGNGFLSPAEGRSAMAMWSMMAWPLWISANLTTMISADLATLLNIEMIAVAQDPLVSAGTRISHTVAGDAFVDIWARPLLLGSWAVAFMNRSSTPQAALVTWAEFGAANPQFTARDIINHVNLGRRPLGYSVVVPSHDVAMVVISPPVPPPSPTAAVALDVIGGAAVQRKSREFKNYQYEKLGTPQLSYEKSPIGVQRLPNPQ